MKGRTTLAPLRVARRRDLVRPPVAESAVLGETEPSSPEQAISNVRRRRGRPKKLICSSSNSTDPISQVPEGEDPIFPLESQLHKKQTGRSETPPLTHQASSGETKIDADSDIRIPRLGVGPMRLRSKPKPSKKYE